MNRRLVLCLLFSVCSGILARGQLLTYSTVLSSAATSWNRTVQLPGFDPAFGTLTGVLLNLSGNSVQTVRVENTDPVNGATYTMETLVTFSAGRTGGPATIVTAAPSLSATGSLGAWDGALNYMGSSGFSVTGSRSASGSSTDANLASYVGTGLIDFFASAALTRSLWEISGSASNIMGSPTTASALLEIQYSYSAVPEPAGCAAALGVMALATAWRRNGKGAGLVGQHKAG